MMRSEPSGLSGLIEIPDVRLICFGCFAVQEVDHGVGIVRAGLEFDAGVEVLRVLADDHHVDVLVARAHAGVGLARTDARVETELVPKRDVDRAEAGADRRRDRAFERDPVPLDRLERLGRQWRARCLHHVDPGLLHVPRELDARRLEHAAGRLGQLGAGPVAGNECHRVRHRGGG